MFAVFGCAFINRPASVFGDVVDANAAVIEATAEKVGVLRVNVQTHDPTLRREDVLGVRRVLEGTEDDHTFALFSEFI